MKYILTIVLMLAAINAPAFSTPALKVGKVYKVKAIVKKVFREDKKIMLDHEEVKGYMKAMTMTFPVEDAKLFDKVTEGTKGVFTMKIVKGYPLITSVKVTSGAPAVYSCPMHPDQHSDKPGACSKCGMDLVKQK